MVAVPPLASSVHFSLGSNTSKNTFLCVFRPFFFHSVIELISILCRWAQTFSLDSSGSLTFKRSAKVPFALGMSLFFALRWYHVKRVFCVFMVPLAVVRPRKGQYYPPIFFFLFCGAKSVAFDFRFISDEVYLTKKKNISINSLSVKNARFLSQDQSSHQPIIRVGPAFHLGPSR